MSEDDEDVIVYRHYCPPEVKRVLASGGSAFIGEVNDSTVLKYPLSPNGDMSRLEVEKQLLEAVGHHDRIIKFKGSSAVGLYLERAVKGNIYQYLVESTNPSPPTIRQRLSWCREATEAVVHVHSRNIIHCDIQPTNLLLDEDLHIKLSDFQGKLLSFDKKVLLDGGSSEPTRFSRPRDDLDNTDIHTDLFALGCTIYFIIMGNAVYPDIKDGEEGWHEAVRARFTKQQFPDDMPVCADLAWKCWLGKYNSAKELLSDIMLVEAAHVEP
ncbi:hypothetical protein QIS74_01230 [Colletotrichum tabaci]|uniref:non-specific serine/threonine protein kinase n=1 Tax=Colletotrichum tabaci TaxID=1209068 RepID=A0AAV9TQ68_9PEZI